MTTRFTIPYWEEAVASACCLQNRTYTRSIDAIPYTLWIGQNPAYDMLRIFGCTAYLFIPSSQRHKLDDHAIKAIMVGYGYRLYDPVKRHFFFSRSLVFDEDGLISANPTPKALPSPSTIADSGDTPTTSTTTTWHTPYDPLAQAQPALPAPIPPQPAAPTPTTVQPLTPAVTAAPHPSLPKWNTSGPRTQPSSTRYHPYGHASRHTGIPSSAAFPSTSTIPSEQPNLTLDDFKNDPITSSSHKLRNLEDIYRTSELTSAPASHPANDEEFAGSAFSLTTVAEATDDLVTIAEALAGPHASEWRKAMEAELSSLQNNNTWTLVPLPADREAVSCKWILRRKPNQDGNIARYKARLGIAKHLSLTSLTLSHLCSECPHFDSYWQ
ncbi:hypothetical protein L7F22_020287 [Adiantum nelumboides]|nr:hypothetical protein [Adiantum nelumboides]